MQLPHAAYTTIFSFGKTELRKSALSGCPPRHSTNDTDPLDDLQTAATSPIIFPPSPPLFPGGGRSCGSGLLPFPEKPPDAFRPADEHVNSAIVAPDVRLPALSGLHRSWSAAPRARDLVDFRHFPSRE
jgi:hypothetical protein